MKYKSGVGKRGEMRKGKRERERSAGEKCRKGIKKRVRES